MNSVARRISIQVIPCREIKRKTMRISHTVRHTAADLEWYSYVNICLCVACPLLNKTLAHLENGGNIKNTSGKYITSFSPNPMFLITCNVRFKDARMSLF